VNGAVLSEADEDGIPNDCYKWHLAGQAMPGYFHEQNYGTNQGSVRFWGEAANPLESTADWAPISWDMVVTMNTASQQAPTAVVTYNHKCYPAHQVKVNGQVVYSFQPSSNSILQITACLTGALPRVTGQTSPIQIPGS
jgi:hypothetical protein